MSGKWNDLGHVRPYRKGDAVFREGERAGTVYLLESGEVKLVSFSAEGKEAVLHVIRPGRLFGLVDSLLDGCCSSTAVVLEDSRIRVIPSGEWGPAMAAAPDMPVQAARDLAKTLQVMTGRLKSLVLYPSVRRLALYLIRQMKRHAPADGQVELHFSRETLASILGTSRETVSRDLAELAEAGAIAVDGRNVAILSRVLLNRLAGSVGEPGGEV